MGFSLPSSLFFLDLVFQFLPRVFSVPFGFFGSRHGCFRFPSKHGVSGSHLWVFSVPVFFLGRSCLLWVRQLPSRSCHGCFRLRLPVVVVVVVVGHCGLEFVDGTGAGGVGALLFIVVLDFVDGTGAGGVGALLFIVVLDFVDGTGAGGVGAVRRQP